MWILVVVEIQPQPVIVTLQESFDWWLDGLQKPQELFLILPEWTQK